MDEGRLQKMRIIYFQQNPALGSCEEYFYLLMEGISRRKFEVIFLSPKNAVLDSLAKRVEALGVKIHRYPTGISNYLLLLHLRAFFQKERPDIVHFNDPCLIGIIAARIASVPVSLMTHHTPELNRKYNFKGRFIEKIAFRYCGLNVIFLSEDNRQIGIKKDKIAQERSFVICHGLPPERFSKRYDKKEIYNEFLIDEGCHIVGNVARLSPQKGQRYLIEAALIVKEKVKSVKFFIVGDGELDSELKTEVREKGLGDYFVFTGYRNDVCRLLSAFEFLVLPSLFEGFPFAVIEAFGMGIPVIATAVGGMRSLIINTETGLLIPPRNPGALAEAIIWMLGHQQESREMGLAGQRRFLELFTQEKMVKNTEELYESLLTKNSKED